MNALHNVDVDGTGSTALDYALINGVFAFAIAALAYATRNKPPEEQPVPASELPMLAAATFALAEVITHEKIASWLRQPFVAETGDHRPGEPRGRGLRRAVGELVTCSRCAGTWSALCLIGLRTAAPTSGRVATKVLTLSAANDIAQAAFRLLTERGNAAAKA